MKNMNEPPAPILRACAAVFALGVMLASAPASAAFIEASASCPGDLSCDGSVADAYGFKFTIADTGDASIFNATLLNTSSTSLADALIDAMAFNMSPTLTLGTHFDITLISLDWNFAAASGGVQFDYVGERDAPGDRIGPNETLSFNFVFDLVAIADDGFTFPANPFDLWLTSDTSAGKGLGGGSDTGQVAVSFQQLGRGGGGSDLLTANWRFEPDEPEEPPEEVIPEPGSLALLGLALAGLAAIRRRRMSR